MPKQQQASPGPQQTVQQAQQAGLPLQQPLQPVLSPPEPHFYPEPEQPGIPFPPEPDKLDQPGFSLGFQQGLQPGPEGEPFLQPDQTPCMQLSEHARRAFLQQRCALLWQMYYREGISCR